MEELGGADNFQQNSSSFFFKAQRIRLKDKELSPELKPSLQVDFKNPILKLHLTTAWISTEFGIILHFITSKPTYQREVRGSAQEKRKYIIMYTKFLNSSEHFFHIMTLFYVGFIICIITAS